MVGFGSDSLRSSGGGGSAQGGFSSGGGLLGFSSSRGAGASGYTAVSSGAGGGVGGGGGGQGLLGSFSSGVQSLRASMSRAPQDSLLAEVRAAAGRPGHLPGCHLHVGWHAGHARFGVAVHFI